MIQKIVLVTGLSGAGKSTCLKILEDLGYEAVDNLPLRLLPTLIDDFVKDPLPVPLAIGIDIRAHDFDSDLFKEQIEKLRASSKSLSLILLYLDCDVDVLQRRYTETRRRHPLTANSLLESISWEQLIMSGLRDQSDIVIDTSETNSISFGRMIRGHLSLDQSPKLEIHLTSFSYRRGLPREADIILDARFLTNPHYEDQLRALTGQDKPVQAFLFRSEYWEPYFDYAKKLIDQSVKGFRSIGRSYLSIGCGCTGGQHRSVFMVEQLGDWLKKQGEHVSITHRELTLR